MIQGEWIQRGQERHGEHPGTYSPSDEKGD